MNRYVWYTCHESYYIIDTDRMCVGQAIEEADWIAEVGCESDAVIVCNALNAYAKTTVVF